MNRSGYDFFSCSSLTLNQNRAVDWCDYVNLFDHSAKRLAEPIIFVEIMSAPLSYNQIVARFAHAANYLFVLDTGRRE